MNDWGYFCFEIITFLKFNQRGLFDKLFGRRRRAGSSRYRITKDP
jgi:hypothetical protein